MPMAKEFNFSSSQKHAAAAAATELAFGLQEDEAFI